MRASREKKLSWVSKNPQHREVGALNRREIGDWREGEISVSLGGTIELKRASMDSNQEEHSDGFAEGRANKRKKAPKSTLLGGRKSDIHIPIYLK